ncbi:MAG: proline dehydrogenase family protein [Candidatus Acidiferrales bacterium]
MSVLRGTLLAASRNAWLREHATRYGFMRRTVRRFLPGETAEEALVAARSLAESGLFTVLTRLGENIKNREEAAEGTQHYLGVTERIAADRLPVEISVKLTQLGLDLDPEFCYANLETIIRATPLEKTLWIDMEQSPYVDPALELYRRARMAFANVGICVQAYLYRTEKDLGALISMGAAVRLVKGAYNEPAEIAYPRKRDVDKNYLHLSQRLLSPEARKAGVRAALATHDKKLIEQLLAWSAGQGIPRNRVEFQMLFGIQHSEQLRLAREGCRCGILISYGEQWYPWFMRRLAERPANLLFLMRNFFSR